MESWEKIKTKIKIKTSDRLMYGPLSDYYGQNGFFNFGYWLEDTQDQKEACENLMEKLLGFIPDKTGTILDVACGLGGSTRYLLKYYSASNLIGITLSMKQIETSKANVPSCSFILMDAHRLGFKDHQFDNIICVEGVNQFKTREGFLREAHRVLKPGGYLVLSDMIFRWSPIMPKGNYIRNLDSYRDLCVKTGFRDVEIVDTINECWIRGFRKHLIRWALAMFRAREIRVLDIVRIFILIITCSMTMRHYILLAAEKI
jgi:MPBQ/MSBQ methyltransferase